MKRKILSGIFIFLSLLGAVGCNLAEMSDDSENSNAIMENSGESEEEAQSDTDYSENEDDSEEEDEQDDD